MVRHTPKGERGIATSFVSRTKAIRKLQLNLKDFRRLCIIKGIYPHEPSSIKKANKGNSAVKTFYYLKDIQFLAHEPLIEKFRQFKIFLRKVKSAQGKRNFDVAERILSNRPSYKLDHVVKERYPTFPDALREMDDVLCMCFLFSTFPSKKQTMPKLVHLCRRVIVEFLHYVIESRSLRKVFISIKGYYYQAEIQGQLVTWVTPHLFAYEKPKDVDFQIMGTFVEFYSTLLGFINFKLFHSLNLHYPPMLPAGAVYDDDADTTDNEYVSERVAALSQSLNRVLVVNLEADVDEFPLTDDAAKLEELRREQNKIKKLQNLFNGLKFYLGREVPREPFVFVIRAFGGEVSWDKTVNVGATFDENDPTITHHVIDRPSAPTTFTTRYYVQPQWVFDSVNNVTLLPVADYFPGTVLPPHLSPFVEELEGDYVPPERQSFLERQKDDFEETKVESEEDESENDENKDEEEGKNEKAEVSPGKRKNARKQSKKNKKRKASVEPGKLEPVDKVKEAEKELAEERRLAVMMIPKKKKRLFKKMMYGKRRKIREVENLKSKREAYDREQKQKKVK